MDNSTQQDLSIEALRAGDRAEFARMVDAYSTLIYRLGLKMLGNQQDAEDILQNTFLNALTHLASFEGRSSISTWLYRIAANEALMMIRRRKSNFNLEDMQPEDSDEIPLPETFVDWSLLPEKELLSGEGKGVLETAIRQLPEIYGLSLSCAM
jgi:RNA polymerase sigma-70 factor (ECF subfamily)